MQHLIAPSLSRSVGSGTHPRLALSRMQMLEQLVLSQGISVDKQSGLTCRALSESGCSGIHHPAESVRKVAERVLLLVYKVNPRLVRKQLPPDDDITRRNLLYRQLFAEFDKIDNERRREMFSTNQRDTTYTSSKNTSPQSPHSSDNSLVTNSVPSKTFPKFSFNGNSNNIRNGTASPLRQVENRIMKSKSGSAINDERKASNGSVASSIDGQQTKANQSKIFGQSNSQSVEDSENEFRCPFCGCPYNGEAEQLDKHYWKACPVLAKCPQCSQVLEVAALNVHLTGLRYTHSQQNA